MSNYNKKMILQIRVLEAIKEELIKEEIEINMKNKIIYLFDDYIFYLNKSLSEESLRLFLLIIFKTFNFKLNLRIILFVAAFEGGV